MHKSAWQYAERYTMDDLNEQMLGMGDEPARVRFDADVALATGELKGLIADLIEALGGEVRA